MAIESQEIVDKRTAAEPSPKARDVVNLLTVQLEGLLDAVVDFRFNYELNIFLPMAARCVIDQQGLVQVVDVNADYTIRPEALETIGVCGHSDS